MQLTELNQPKGKRLSRHLKIDMTPMVDLGFLLITFFIFTTTIGEAKAMKLYMPADHGESNNGETSTLTAILPGGNKIAFYAGSWEKAFAGHAVSYIQFADLRVKVKEQREKMKSLGLNPADLMLLIKPAENASYSNTIDALDEAMISNIGKYAIVDITQQEQAFVDGK
jgi:biopolymer transport protein ExbD